MPNKGVNQFLLLLPVSDYECFFVDFTFSYKFYVISPLSGKTFATSYETARICFKLWKGILFLDYVYSTRAQLRRAYV